MCSRGEVQHQQKEGNAHKAETFYFRFRSLTGEKKLLPALYRLGAAMAMFLWRHLTEFKGADDDDAAGVA